LDVKNHEQGNGTELRIYLTNGKQYHWKRCAETNL